jgi:predicted ATP-dependent serine protease
MPLEIVVRDDDDPLADERRSALHSLTTKPALSSAENSERGTSREAQRLRRLLLKTSELNSIDPPQPLLGGLLFLDTLALAYGPSGVGKSFAAIDIAMSIASDLENWHGHAISHGPVLYVIAEGAAGVKQRVEAWQQHHRLKGKVIWLPEAVDLLDSESVDGLSDVVREIRPALIVIDTLSRSIAGADENSSRDMGVIVNHLTRLQAAARSCVLIVHHTGKDASKAARGHSLLRAAMDTEVSITGSPQSLRIRNTKQKNAPERSDIHLAAISVGGTGSVALSSSHASSTSPAGAAKCLEKLREIDAPGGVPLAAWRRASTSGEDAVSDPTFYRHKDKLLRDGRVKVDQPGNSGKWSPAEQ